MDTGDHECSSRARLFPLPYYHERADVWWSPHRSARITRRRKVTRMVTTVTNRCIFTLNRMYSHTAQPPPSHASMHHHHVHTHKPTHRKQGNITLMHAPGAHAQEPHPAAPSRRRTHTTLDPARDLPSSASRQQLRLIFHLRSRCASFVLAARSSPNVTTGDSSVGISDEDLATDVFTSYSFDAPSNSNGHHGSPDQSHTRTAYTPSRAYDIEGPLHTHAMSASAAAAVLSSTAGFSTSSTSVVPLIADRVSLPGPDPLHVVPLISVLPTEHAQTYSDATRGASLLRPPLEILALDVTAPLKPPRIAGARREYVGLVRRMLKLGMLRMTSKPKAVNGVFAVAKDADADRLIIDAQPANRLFIDAPPIALPNPSHLVQLRVPRGRRLVLGKSDLSNFYHHLGLPDWMVDYFALPPLTKEELEDLGLSCGDGAMWPACITLPMGFSHAVFLAQTAHMHVLYSSLALSPSDNILNLLSPDVPEDGTVHGLIVDDFFLFSLDDEIALRVFNAVLDAYKSAGFVVKPSKVVAPTRDPVKVIGFMIGMDADHRTTIALSGDACVALARATLALLRRGLSTGTQLSHIIGRWTWCMLLRRPSLAVLQHVYRYIECAGRRRFTLWPSVRRELWMLLGLLPLLHAQLDVPIFRHAIASDASELAAGVVCTAVTPNMERRIWQLCSTRRHATLQTQINSMQHRGVDLEMESTLAHAAADEYAAFYADILAARWSTIISSAWRSPEHINALELRAVLLALHWCLSYPSSHSSRVYLLVDSTVALFALWKGRSSSAPLLMIVRKINALLMASGTSLLIGWLPSAVNPADAPSRLCSRTLDA